MRESQKTDSAEPLCKMAGNFRSPMNRTYSKGLSSQIFESRLTCILTKWMFWPPKLVSENRLYGPISIEGRSQKENLESSSYEKTAMKSAINCQSKESLQFSAIEFTHNHFNFGAP